MIKRVLISILAVSFCFPITSAQEKDPVIAKIESLKKSYLAGDIGKSLSILSKIENLLREESISQKKGYSD